MASSGQKPKRHIWNAIQEDQKQKIRVINFGVNSKQESVLNCNINAIREKDCFKCGSKGHFIKDCSFSQQDTEVQKGKYTDKRPIPPPTAYLTRSWSL